MADLSTLERLAEDGFGAVHGDELSSLVAWTWDWGIASGDARFSVISVVLGRIDTWWSEHDELGGVPSEALREVESLLGPGLRDALAASTAASGAQFAQQCGMELSLTGADDWVARGWATRS